MKLQGRLDRLEKTRAQAADSQRGLNLNDLDDETKQAMADAYAETLDCPAPDPDAFQIAFNQRLAAARDKGLGLRGLCDGDLSAIVAAGDHMKSLQQASDDWDRCRDATRKGVLT